MSTLQSLREARSIVRWMLLCFALSIGVAVAAPLLNPQPVELVCTATGNVKLVPVGEGSASTSPASDHALHCVLCLPFGAPPATELRVPAAPDLGLAFAASRPQAALWRLADPTSARDPPVVL
jgi:hypothetical protein